MVASRYQRNRSAAPRAAPLAGPLVQRVRQYFDRHPEVSREAFLLEAVWREFCFCEQKEIQSRAAGMRPTTRRRSAEDIRFQAVLAAHLAVRHYERYGFWPRVRRFLAGLR